MIRWRSGQAAGASSIYTHASQQHGKHAAILAPPNKQTAVFASIGRVVWRDVGPTAVCFRLLMKVRLPACLPAFVPAHLLACLPACS